MFNLFEPQTKVQKDRQIIRDTDMRMAKYSRRGLISNFLIYTLCLLFEQKFIAEHQRLAIVLTGGLLLATIIRGYFLFRVESIYPRAPTAWRNKYFAATLMGACWWGLILAYVTLYMDMKGEAALMWLYTVVFFSTTAHAFAPYKNFLSIYQFIGLVPAACCTFFIGEYIGAFYGFILLFFYMILNHHCSLMSLNYWERLEAQYTLAKKSFTLEEEKRDTRASVQLTNEYIEVLRNKMLTLLESPHGPTDQPPEPVTIASQRAIFEKLYHNVDDFNQVVTKELAIHKRVFNVRHYIQSIACSMINEAESKSIELETSLSPALPARLIGDSQRIGQIISTILQSVIRNCNEGVLFMEVEFIREFERSGELLITVLHQNVNAKRSFFQASESSVIPLNLGLVLAKGIAEVMNGSLDVDVVGSNEGKHFHLRVPLDVAETESRPEYHRLAYKGRPLLLIHSNARWLDQKRLELCAMGFGVRTATDFKSGYQILNEEVAKGKAIQSVVYKALPEEDQPINFCNELLEHNELKYIHQFIVCSPLGRDFFSRRTVSRSPQLHYVKKPSGFFEFEMCLNSIFEMVNYESTEAEADQQCNQNECSVLWVSLTQDFQNSKVYETEYANIQQVGDVKQLQKLLAESSYDVVVVEQCLMPNPESAENVVEMIREFEISDNRKNLLPIVGLGDEGFERDILEAGADHFVHTSELHQPDPPDLQFWMRSGHH